MKKVKGFTLIELLVVIAIIGILATVIIGSLNDARIAGVEAKIKSEMDSLTKQAAYIESSVYTFDSVCGSNGVTQSPEVLNTITSIETFASSTVACNSAPTEYAVSVAVGTGYWCVDSVGTRKEISTALPVGDTVCP